MNFGQALILAAIQGVTEFLPVSSSGHLVIIQKLLGLDPPVLFDTLVHFATLIAILVFFRRQIFKISFDTLKLIFIGSIPTVVAGVILLPHISRLFNSFALVGGSLTITGILLLITGRLPRGTKRTGQLNKLDALLIGTFQALSILPGISRSGVTISAGRWQGATPKTAFRFSFLLSIPAIIGALVIQLPELVSSSQAYLFQSAVSMLVAGGFGLLSLRILEKLLASAKVWWLGIYCFFVGGSILLFT
jgi:undecaprenyl-diphosphatase